MQTRCHEFAHKHCPTACFKTAETAR